MVRKMSENATRGAECSEHPAPLKTPGSTVTKTEGLGHYDTGNSRLKEATKNLSAKAGKADQDVRSLGANEERFVFEDDPDERTAIQNEPRLEEGA